LVLIGGGATIPVLAEAVGVTPRTFKRYLAEGRASGDSQYAALAVAFDSARPAEALGTGPMTDEEFELHLAAAIRARNVQAMRLYEDRRLRRGDEGEGPAFVDPLAGVDELAARRRQAGA